jgi:hypothetical protein
VRITRNKKHASYLVLDTCPMLFKKLLRTRVVLKCGNGNITRSIPFSDRYCHLRVKKLASSPVQTRHVSCTHHADEKHTWSAAFLSPLPSHCPPAKAAASVTRTNSSAKFLVTMV